MILIDNLPQSFAFYPLTSHTAMIDSRLHGGVVFRALEGEVEETSQFNKLSSFFSPSPTALYEILPDFLKTKTCTTIFNIHEQDNTCKRNPEK